MSIVLDRDEINRSLKRISHEIVERNHGLESLILVGIPTRGVALAERIGGVLATIESPVEIGHLDITLYRDDLRSRAPKAIADSHMPLGGIEDKTVVLVDDVLFSGRTVRAALDALSEYGRPKNVQLAVLIDRGHRELPIRADYVGKNVPTNSKEVVKVLLSEVDGIDQVEIEQRR